MDSLPLTVVRGSCHHDCPDTCVWEVGVRQGRAVSLRGSLEHPTTAGRLCPKVNRYLDRVYHPDRILTPMRRCGPKGSGRFEPISWDEALDTLAERLRVLRDAGRREAVLQFSFAGTQGVIQSGVVADAFFDRFGASDIRRHLCGATAAMGAADVFGGRPARDTTGPHQRCDPSDIGLGSKPATEPGMEPGMEPSAELGTGYGMDPLALAQARTILLWGTDPMITNRHLWPFIEQAKAQGATVVVIDPVRTATAAKADRHLQLRPGTDVALVLAVIGCLDRSGALDAQWIADRTTGWDALRTNASAQPLAQAAAITGLTPKQISDLAELIANQRPFAIRTLLGAEHRQYGRDIMAALATLAAVTGAMREPGGGLARSTQNYFDTALNLPQLDTPRRRFNMARLGAVLTDPRLDPAIELLMVHNANPAVTVPGQNDIIKGLERQDLYTVVIEQFMTDTARYADLILPSTTQVEQWDLGLAWGHLYLSLNTAAIAPVGQCLPNTEVFRRLATRLNLTTRDGAQDPWLTDSDEDLIARVLNSGHPWLHGITLDGLRHRPWHRLAVPDQYPQPARYRLTELRFRVADESPDGAAGQRGRYPLALLTRKQQIAFLNAQYGAFAAHQPGHGQLRVTLHPVDAQARAIGDGDQVRVFNDRGELSCHAQIDDTTQPGLVTMPFGWWNQATESGRGVNALTNPEVGDDDLGSAAFHDTLVEVALLS